ncbi:MAG: hypothetical protein IPJ34_26475 [Myxococcales bacterium]|nr:hypothetical protein [Myxococcales bacterium]
MPKHVADELQAVSLADLIGRQPELVHIRVRRHGVLLILESGPKDDPVAHARFRRLGAHIWRLEMSTHTGGWEATPFRGQIEILLEALITDFPWTLTPIA